MQFCFQRPLGPNDLPPPGTIVFGADRVCSPDVCAGPLARTPKGLRFAYDQSVRMVGAEVVEVSDQATFEAALREHTVVAVLMLAERDVGAPLTFDQMLPAAKAADVPIMVDAASEALTVPERWTARGADMVVYSVSKLMRGPAASGLLLGRKSLVQAAWYNGPPHQGFGRAMKISKSRLWVLLPPSSAGFRTTGRPSSGAGTKC